MLIIFLVSASKKALIEISSVICLIICCCFRDDTGRLRVFSIKVALATLCAGKLLDKLRYIFSQISDAAGVMDLHRFDDYLREVLALPAAVFEGPTFAYNESAAKGCFDPVSFLVGVLLKSCCSTIIFINL